MRNEHVGRRETTMTNTEIKERIKELEEQKTKIVKEIFNLTFQNTGYWMGIIETKESCTFYYAIGCTSEAEAREKLNEAKIPYDALSYEIKEVSEEYFDKLYDASLISSVLTTMEDKVFDPYDDFYCALADDLKKREEELGIYGEISRL